MAYVGQQANAQWGQGSWQSVATQATASGVMADLNGGKFGHGFWAAGFNAFQQGPNSGPGYGQNLNSFGDYARSFGNYMINAYTQEELGRFAKKNGMTLTELNILLTVNSFIGRGFASGANIYSLPFGNVSETGVNTTLGMFDPVNGGVLGMLFNPFGLLVDSNVFPYHSCAENYGDVCAR